MSRKPGAHVSKIAKGNAHLPGFAADLTVASGEISEQLVILRREDIHADAPAPPPLDWSKIEKGEIAVQMKDLDGLTEGNVTINASTLQRLHPLLVPERFDADYPFQVSLRSVVMQVQGNLRRSPEDGPVRSRSEFDTPIAQIAREDEGYFKLEKFHVSQEPAADRAAQPKPKSPEPVLTPADRPAARLLRQARIAPEPGEPPTLKEAPRLVTAPVRATAQSPERRSAETGQPGSELRAKSHRERIGHEQLREIFMTEEYLGVDTVADRIAGLPKICSALVMLADGTVLGGTLPEGYRLETAILAPALMRNVQEFGRGLRFGEPTAFTFLGERPISLFAEGNIHILVCHEGRGLVAGMRKRIGEIAAALDAICSAPPEAGLGESARIPNQMRISRGS
ncbi:MAG TPA: hypothetical protein VJX28_01955 [Chthoniobacterales bacterium]|nr:hypothetical protein [Chthoniobacterales bacterium]